ncbi:hypothetical protein AOLI_G00198420 [Acnodon oligacanthus]
MERSRAVLITLTCVLFSRISGADVETRVRPGDDVTLYSDCFSEAAFNIVWLRNSSCQHERPLMISTPDLISGAFPRHTPVWNPSNKTHDLLVKNVSESDVGLYYCAAYTKNITIDEKGVLHSGDVYHYGKRTTRLSLLGPEDGREVLTGNVFQVGCAEEHQCEKSMNGSVLFSRISGAEVEVRVRPGDDVTLYSDWVWEKLGFKAVWFRSSSCQHEPPLIMSFETIDPQHYTFVWKPSYKTHDLLARNVTESDVGLYYCAVQEIKIGYDDHVIHYTDVYHYENRTTRLSVSGLFSRISGAEVEVRVRPGDDVTLYSDCVWEKLGFNTVWFRNSSCQHEPFLIISFELMTVDPQHYTFVWNSFNKTHDLLVKNITESHVGLYYCAIREKKVVKDETGVIRNQDAYQYGNRATRLSLLVPCSADIPQTTCTPPVSDCSICWKLLVSVCPACALLSSTCVYCICRNRFKEAEARQERRKKTQSRKSRKTEEVEAGEVCYASLDILSRGQKRPMKKRVESSDFSTYSEVKTDQM